jgi:hypothetical protein
MTVTTFTGGVAASMASWAPPGSDLDLMNQALAGMFETPYGVVADQGSPDEPADYQPGWGVLLDPTACASLFPLFLPWLALFVGAVVPIGTPESTALQAILAEQGFQRGTGFGGTYTTANGAQGGAIVTAAQSQLTGSQSVNLIERINAAGNPDPYHFVLVVLTSQVVSLAALTAAVQAVKPGGVMFTIIETTAWTIGEFETGYSTIALAEAAFASIGALEGDVT